MLRIDYSVRSTVTFTLALAAAALALSGSLATTASAAGAESSATGAPALKAKVKKLERQARKATRRSNAACRKARRAARTGAARKANRRCAAARKRARSAKRRLDRSRRALRRARGSSKASAFDVCKHGCAYKTVQKAVDAAGRWQRGNRARRATVRVQPGEYVEGVYLYGPAYDNLRIIGVDRRKRPLEGTAAARTVKLQGRGARTDISRSPGWSPGDPRFVPANNAIEGRDVQGLVMKNMWAENYLNNTFFVWASTNPSLNEHCSDFVMDNLVSSDTRAYGLFARNCYGGVIRNSEGWNHGDSAVYIGETPCDDPAWTGKSDKPCQANPQWTVIENFKSHQNTLGYSGTNSKYVEIKNSAFFNNGAGIVPNTLDSERFEPAGWMKIHDNDIFWNNYNYQSTGSEFESIYTWSDFAPGGLGEVLGQAVSFPMGVGVMLFGSDGVEVTNNRIFGNEKWGAMTFSAPVAEAFGVVANEGDDAKSLNNHFVGNEMGRDGLDPNGTDFLSDYTGGGNCWSGNTAAGGVTYTLGTGGQSQASIYPPCPQGKRMNRQTSSFDVTAGIQVRLDGNQDPILDPDTIIGYVALAPAKLQECSWSTPGAATGPNRFHPAFTDASGHAYLEKRADPVTCP